MPTEIQELKMQNLRLARALQQATMQHCQVMLRLLDVEETALGDEINKSAPPDNVVPMVPASEITEASGAGITA
jgi:hypothetical protein